MRFDQLARMTDFHFLSEHFKAAIINIVIVSVVTTYNVLLPERTHRELSPDSTVPLKSQLSWYCFQQQAAVFSNTAHIHPTVPYLLINKQ